MVRQVADAAKKSGGAVAGAGGAAAVGILETLDWLWDVGLKYQQPTLYEFLHLEYVSLGIAWMITSCVVWVTRGRR